MTTYDALTLVCGALLLIAVAGMLLMLALSLAVVAGKTWKEIDEGDSFGGEYE